MGCDIHGFARVRSYEGSWHNIARVPHDRNYTLFALLANVRNYDGVRPYIDTDEVRPQLPDDVLARCAALDYGKAYDRPDYYFHDIGDHSFITVEPRALLEWDGWDQVVNRTRWVAREEYERFKRDGGEPQSYCGGVYGPNIVHAKQADVEAGTAPEGWNYVEYTWPVKVREECTTFLHWLQWIADEYCWLTREGKPFQEVQIIIGFDS